MYPTPDQLAEWAMLDPEYDLKSRIVNLKKYACSAPTEQAQRALDIIQAYERKLLEAAE
jgi:hypothetical protein